MTAALPGPATSRLTHGVIHPQPVNGGRWYRPARRPPCSSLKPGLDRSGTTACVAVRHPPPRINAHRAAWTSARTASTLTVANIRPSVSILPMTGPSASIWTVALNRRTPRTARLTVDRWSSRSPENRPESGSAWTVSDPLNGTRSESLRTVRNPRTAYAISRITILHMLRGACRDSWYGPEGSCENDSMTNRNGSILSIGSTGSILSIGSAGSILSIGSAGSILSVGSVSSIGSVFSVGSAASAGSILSALSCWSVLAWKGRAKGRPGGAPVT